MTATATRVPDVNAAMHIATCISRIADSSTQAQRDLIEQNARIVADSLGLLNTIWMSAFVLTACPWLW